MSRKILIWTLPLFFILFSWSNPDLNNPELDEEITTANQLIQLVNAHRETIGKPILIRNATADKLAMEHTNYMISKKNLSGDNFELRWDVLDQKENAQEISENVGFGYDSALDAMQASKSMVWLKVNLEGDFTHTGIAVKKDSNGKYYYTQIFYN